MTYSATKGNEASRLNAKRPGDRLAARPFQFAFRGVLARPLTIDHQIVGHAEHARNSTSDNVHCIVIAFTGHETFKRHMAAVDDQSDRRVHRPKVARKAAGI